MIDTLKLDTLIHVLTLEQENERTVNAYLELAKEYDRVHDYAIALTYADLALDMSKDVDYSKGELEANLLKAHTYLAYYLDYEKAIHYYDEALVLAEELKANEALIRVYKGYMVCYSGTGRYELSIEFNKKAIELAEVMNDDEMVSNLSAYGGTIYEESGDTAKAKEMYEQVLQIETDRNFLHTSNAALLSVAHYYFLNGEIEKSLDQYRSAITRFERLGDMRWTSYAHAEIAKVYLHSDHADRAEKHGKRGLEIAIEFELTKEKADNYYALSLYYEAIGKNQKAEEYKNSYRALVDSVSVELDPREVFEEEEVEASSSDLYQGIWNTLIILVLIGLVVFIAGLQFKNS